MKRIPDIGQPLRDMHNQKNRTVETVYNLGHQEIMDADAVSSLVLYLTFHGLIIVKEQEVQ